MQPNIHTLGKLTKRYKIYCYIREFEAVQKSRSCVLLGLKTLEFASSF